MQAVDHRQSLRALLTQAFQSCTVEAPAAIAHQQCDDEVKTLQHRHHGLAQHQKLECEGGTCGGPDQIVSIAGQNTQLDQRFDGVI